MAGNHLKKLPYWGNAESSRDSLSRTLNGTVNNLFGGDQGLVRDGVVGAVARLLLIRATRLFG